MAICLASIVALLPFHNAVKWPTFIVCIEMGKMRADVCVGEFVRPCEIPLCLSVRDRDPTFHRFLSKDFCQKFFRSEIGIFGIFFSFCFFPFFFTWKLFFFFLLLRFPWLLIRLPRIFRLSFPDANRQKAPVRVDGRRSLSRLRRHF